MLKIKLCFDFCSFQHRLALTIPESVEHIVFNHKVLKMTMRRMFWTSNYANLDKLIKGSVDQAKKTARVGRGRCNEDKNVYINAVVRGKRKDSEKVLGFCIE